LLNENIQILKGIGPAKSKILQTDAGIETIEDLLYYIPRKYIDRSSFKKISECPKDEIVTVAGTIISTNISGKRKRFFEVEISDGTESLFGIFFGGIQYFMKLFQEDDFVIFSGKIKYFGRKQIVHPEFDFVDNKSNIHSINTGRIIPLYKSTEGLKGIRLDSRGFRKLIKTVIDDFLHFTQESLDQELLDKYGMPGIEEALFSIHFPDNFTDAESARKRLAFNEIFFLQYYLLISKKYSEVLSQKKLYKPDKETYDDFIKNLPFELTQDQKNSIEDISKDLLSPVPMNRLLQGDVGSGKTVVAMASALLSVSNGNQIAIMAPTEVLASQHFSSFKKLMPPSIRTFLLTGNTKKKEKKVIWDAAEQGDADIIIGTHALIQDSIIFKNLRFIIIDEQHRFGVRQRAELRKKGKDTDLLIMTATPIPRSLSMTFYGDLNISSIKSKPADRLPIKTISLPVSRIKGVYNSMEKYISQNRQVYYILPLIEESEKIDLKSAIEVYEKLKTKIFTHRNVDIIHGKMKSAEKDEVMKKFNNAETDILVSTTVIEVGIDVPNASVIIIEHPERFGLSQLHQLRGRVGRGKHQSFCVLVYPDSISEQSKKRINVLESTEDGFIISEEDLRLRGAGELTGDKQHGHNGFEFADLLLDTEIIKNARYEAENYISAIDDVNEMINNIDKEKYSRLIEGIRKKKILSILS